MVTTSSAAVPAHQGAPLQLTLCPARPRPLPSSPQNKVIFNYFPYPWFVSTVHVVVGSLYCIATYLLGAKKASFERVRRCTGVGPGTSTSDGWRAAAPPFRQALLLQLRCCYLAALFHRRCSE